MKRVVVLFFALLPLQWLALGDTPIGRMRLHQAVILGLALLILVQFPLRRYAPVLRTSAVFVVANAYLLVVVVAVQVYNGAGPLAPIPQLLYLVSFVALAALFHRVAAGVEPALLRTLRYASLVLCGSLLIGLSVAMSVNGVNPAAVLGQTIATADPEVFQKEIYKSAFAGFGIDEEEVRGNFRHEIFGSVLLSMLISTWAMRTGEPPSSRHRRAYGAAMVLGISLLALSLSRSIVIAALVWPLLAMLRSTRRGELTTKQIAIFYATVMAFGGLLVSGLGAVIGNRFLTDTTGYDARASNYDDAFAALPDVWVTGGYATAGESSHNFVFDTLLRHGIFAAAAAVVILMFLLVVFALLALRLHRLPASMVPVVAALALPLVRLGTAGGGQIPPVEWVALAFVAGVLVTRRARQREVTELDSARPAEPVSTRG